MHGHNVVNSRIVNVCSHLRRVLPKRPTGLFLLVKIGSVSRSLTPSDVMSVVHVAIRHVQGRSPSAGLCLRDLLPFGRDFNQCGGLAKGASVIPRVGSHLRTFTGRRNVTCVGLFPLFARGKAGMLHDRLANSKLRLGRSKCGV